MTTNRVLESVRQYEIPGTVEFDLGGGGLPRTRINTPWSKAEIYLHGAQVTRFEKHGEPPLLFLGTQSLFQAGKAIRGGVPICFPWFGPRPGEVGHGFARITEWELVSTKQAADGGVVLRFQLPIASKEWSELKVEFMVRATSQLALELVVANRSPDQQLTFENCFHTYFAVGDIGETLIRGLSGARYRDETRGGASALDEDEVIRIGNRVDRTYLDAFGPMEIQDRKLRRAIRIEKSGSASTIVWNPWTTQPLADLGPDEYRRMVCVESGNVGLNAITLLPGESSTLQVILSSHAGA